LGLQERIGILLISRIYKFRDAKFRGSQLYPPEDGRVAEAYSHFQDLPRGRASVLSFLPPSAPLKEPATIKPPKPGQVICGK